MPVSPLLLDQKQNEHLPSPEHPISFINVHHGIVQSSTLVVVYRINRLSKLRTWNDDEVPYYPLQMETVGAFENVEA